MPECGLAKGIRKPCLKIIQIKLYYLCIMVLYLRTRLPGNNFLEETVYPNYLSKNEIGQKN